MSIIASLSDWSRESVASAGYPGLAGLIMLENIIPPIPSEVILPLAGFYVGQGELSFPLAVAAATAGSLLGALVIYALSRRGGRPLLIRFGSVIRVTEGDIDRSDEWFEQWGDWLVFGGRMLPGLRSLVSIPAGLSRMPIARFALLTAAGSAIWNAALIGLGWSLGANYDKVATIIGPAGSAVLGAFIVLLAATLAWLFLRNRRQSN